jgi:uncharacterized protein YjdB
VTDITLSSASELTAGETLTLQGKVVPENATEKTIHWSITSDGGTGTSLTGADLTATKAGIVRVTATISGGGSGVDYSKSFDIVVRAPFVSVTDIVLSGNSFVAGESLKLAGTVRPDDATVKTINWSIVDAGKTGAALKDSVLTASHAGLIRLKAVVADGRGKGLPFEKIFGITVHPPFVQVKDLTLQVLEMKVGESLTLEPVISPADATEKTVVFEIDAAGTTGATLAGRTLSAVSAGTVTIKAVVSNGLGTGIDFVRFFAVAVTDPAVYVTDITLPETKMMAGTELVLYPNVLPENATHKTVTWQVKDAGTTGAVVKGNVLSARAGGKITLTASIDEGGGRIFKKDLEVNVFTAFAAVTDITGIPSEIEAGSKLTLAGKVVPENATNQSIVWAMTSTGTTGARLEGNLLTPAAAGTLRLRAYIRNGAGVGVPFLKDFEIKVVSSAAAPEKPVFSINLRPSINVTEGGQLLLFVQMQPSSAESVSYQWYRNNTPIEGANASGYEIKSASPLDAGSYYVVVTNRVGSSEASATSATCEVHITALPLVEYAVTAGADLSYRGGAEGLTIVTNIPFGDFNSVAVNGTIISPSNYLAREGSTSITLSAQYLSSLSDGIYTVRINAVNGYAETVFSVSLGADPAATQTGVPTATSTGIIVPTRPTPTKTAPEKPASTGEKSPIPYILIGSALVLFAVLLIYLMVRRRRRQDDDFGDFDDNGN